MERDWIEKIYQEALAGVFVQNPKLNPTSRKVQNGIKKTLPHIINKVEKVVQKESRKVLRERKRDIREFKSGLLKRWGKAFDLLEVFISYNLDHGMIVSDSFRRTNEKSIRFETLLRLHARGCQLSFEILELLRGGFADGATARWRSLYEIAVFANFLKGKPEELTQRYLDYSIVENYYEAVEYQKNCKRLGERPLTKKEMVFKEQAVNLLREKYGADYVKPYGWAAEYLARDKRNFSGMEETIPFNQMKSHYKLANNYVHGGAKAFLFKMGMIDSDKVMLAGPTNYGMADPGQNTAYTLLQITTTLTPFDFFMEDLVFVAVAERRIADLSEEFVWVQHQIEDEDKIIKEAEKELRRMERKKTKNKS